MSFITKTVFALALLFFSLGCGKDGETTIEYPFNPGIKTTTVTYDMQRFSGETTLVSIKWAGEQRFQDKKWDDFQVTYPIEKGDVKVDIFGHITEAGYITVAGYKFDYPPGATNTDYTVVLDKPESLDTQAIPLGKQQTRTFSGTLDRADNAQPIKATILAHYTKTDDNATVDCRLGTVSGVKVFTGDVSILEGEGWDLLDKFKGMKVTGKVWYHPQLGVLNVDVDGWPIGAAFTGEQDCGDPDADDYKTIQKTGVLSTQDPKFTLSSYDCDKQLDADKMRHAQMLLELRWADKTKAATQNKPMVDVQFGTAFGYFPSNLTASPVSIFYPEENSQGYTYWYAFVNQGAKNEPGDNGILYKIDVSFPDFMSSPVRVTARIRYPVYR